MSSDLPAYVYRHRDAVKRDEPKKFTDALIASGRFLRDCHGFVQFKISPNEFLRVENKHMLRELLLSGECVCFDGDQDDAVFDCVWSWFAARRWTFPRLDPAKPWDPPKPLPVRHAGVTPGARR